MSREDLFVAMSGRRYRVERFWGTLPDGMELGLVSMLAVGPHGSVAVATRNGPPVVVFDADGMFRTAWPEEGVADPHGINFTHDGRVILVDRDAHEIQFRTLEGERVATLGRRHHPAFQAPFNHPTSAFAAKDGDIYVADGYGNNVVHRFAADGSLISTWGGAGTGPGEFSTPHSVLVDQLDRVLVVDRENNRV
ncbi:MAG: peptidase, partial [Chromatiales bacterium]|nr:peptidase [Chromatiales bacterium]